MKKAAKTGCLCCFAEQGRLELAEALIQAAREATQEKGDKKVQEAVQKVVDYADFSGMTPLMYACQQGCAFFSIKPLSTTKDLCVIWQRHHHFMPFTPSPTS